VNDRPSDASRDDPAAVPAPLKVVAIVPVGALEGAKSRLGEALDAEERRELVISMLRRTLGATAGSPRLAETIVVTPDDEVQRIARAAGARSIAQRGQGLNQGLREAREAALASGADAVLVVPADLPLVSAAALSAIVAELDDPRRPLVVVVPDRHRRGTNALLIAPPAAIEFCFGGDSRAAHESCARDNGARFVQRTGGPLALDLDTPNDLLLVEGLPPGVVDAH
jgi:2-phospho-L-lactate/phosphoenolpyruvate guanylyltransferase